MLRQACLLINRMCRACMHSFFIDCQSLRELRITSVLMIAAIQQRNVGRIKCNGPVNFFSERSTGGRRWPAATPPPPHPGSLVVPGQGLETNRGWGGGEGHGLGPHVVLIYPINTRETTAAYTGLLGWDLNSKFFSYKFM
jgi:hypothetical protein